MTARKQNRKGKKRPIVRRSSPTTRHRKTHGGSATRKRSWLIWLALLVVVSGGWAYSQGWLPQWLSAPQSVDDGSDPGASQPRAPAASTPSTPRYALPDVAREEPPEEDEIILPPSAAARVALVIDDLGRSVDDVLRIERFGVPVTYSVLPFESRTAQVVSQVLAGGHELLCHLPMEPATGANPGPGALTSSMSRRQLAEATRDALAAVPGAVGVNNHMGSGLTTDRKAMGSILRVIENRELYFLDSRTSSDSVGYSVAVERGIPAARRQVFLDGEMNREWVDGQIRRALAIARREGAAVVIGHPHDVTLSALEDWIPQALDSGYQFVPVSALLERSDTPAS